jgi:hypothetical protein
MLDGIEGVDFIKESLGSDLAVITLEKTISTLGSELELFYKKPQLSQKHRDDFKNICKLLETKKVCKATAYDLNWAAIEGNHKEILELGLRLWLGYFELAKRAFANNNPNTSWCYLLEVKYYKSLVDIAYLELFNPYRMSRSEVGSTGGKTTSEIRKKQHYDINKVKEEAIRLIEDLCPKQGWTSNDEMLKSVSPLLEKFINSSQLNHLSWAKNIKVELSNWITDDRKLLARYRKFKLAAISKANKNRM